VTDAPDALAANISRELAACCERGIERLDVRSHNQVPVERPELQRLASAYSGAKGLHVQGGVAQLKLLLRDAVTAFADTSETDARLVSALFFGDSQDRVTKSAGELLDITQKQAGYRNDVRFRQARHGAFDGFADFLPRFVARVGGVGGDGDSAAGPVASLAPQPQGDGEALVPEVQQRVATTGYVDNGEHFIDLLSQAENVTIVGSTNEMLARMLRIALARKRAALLRPDQCWSSVRVVFLSDELLDRVNDERGYPDPIEARLLRRRLAVQGRRTVRVFLRTLPGRTSWGIYDSPLIPQVAGTLFEMPDGRRIVQLLVRRRRRRSSDHLYLEFEDTRGHYFSEVFEEIVEGSVDDNKVVATGIVAGNRFRVTSTRYRRSVLIDNSGARGWLAMVLVMTWRLRDGRAEPVLQLRTEQNATRELDRFTHLAGHIMQDEPAVPGTEFGLIDDVPRAAARHRVQMETGEAGPGEFSLEPLATGRYIHSDKEHLFFFIYGCQLPEGLHLWEQAEMSALTVEELLGIRENQVLRKALSFCDAVPARGQVRALAAEIVACNLELHGYGALAHNLTDVAAAAQPDFSSFVAEVRVQEQRTLQAWPTFGGDTEIVGLAGLQFREFYTIFLPVYARVGVPGADDHLELINRDQAKRAAIARLSVLYHDERLMELIPIEL
jgi:hypothetical protein